MKRLSIVAVALLLVSMMMVGCSGGPKKTRSIKSNVNTNEFFLTQQTAFKAEHSSSSKTLAVFRKNASVVVYRRSDDDSWAFVKALHYDEKVYEGWVPSSRLSKSRSK